MKNHGKLLTALIVLLIANLAATGVIGFLALRPREADGKTSQYVMYVGTNDKDTYEQIIPTEEAMAIIDTICFEYVDGYTIQSAVGSWVDEKGIPTHEDTIVCYFDDTDEKTVYLIADKVLQALNQNTVLIEKDEIRIDYYNGTK